MRKFVRKQLTLKDCIKIYHTVNKLPRVIAKFETCEGEYKEKFLEMFNEPLIAMEGEIQRFRTMLETTIDFDKAAQNEFMIRSDFSEDLSGILK